MKFQLVSVVCIYLILIGCKESLHVSGYSKFNEFYYKDSIPWFRYKNDSLNIAGYFRWNGNARVIPKIKYLPDSIKNIAKIFLTGGSSVLFATYNPRRKKFIGAGYVPVTRKDVRRKSIFPHLYEIVSFSKTAFNQQNTDYLPIEDINSDFRFYRSTAIKRINDKWRVYEIVAADTNGYYKFTCIFDIAYLRNDSDSSYQIPLFTRDVTHLNKKGIMVDSTYSEE